MPKLSVRTIAKSHSVLNALYKIKQCEKDKELMCVCVCVCVSDRQTDRKSTYKTTNLLTQKREICRT